MGKKKEKRLGVAYGKTKDPEIMRELSNEQTLEILGGVPIYVHSNVKNAKIGLKTAEKMVDVELKKAESVAKAELTNQLAYLRSKRKRIEKRFNKDGQLKMWIQQFTSDDTVQNKIRSLLDLKSNTTALSKLQKAWKDKKKEESLIEIGSGKNKVEMDLGTYSRISNQLRTNMADIIKTMGRDENGKWDGTLSQAVEQYADKFMATLTEDKTRVATSKFDSRKMSQNIGWFFELMFNDMRFPCGSVKGKNGQDIGIEIGLRNLSAGFKKDDKSVGAAIESYNKSDTLICFYKAGQDDPFLSFPVSDKTGIEGRLETISDDLKEMLHQESVFTANINESFSPNSKPESRVIGGKLTDNQYGKYFNSAARYILGNTEILIQEQPKDEQNSDKKTSTKIQNSYNKLLRSKIAAVIMWSAAVVEVTGLLKPKNAKTKTELPLFIRHYDKLYYTEDILNSINLTSGLNIISANFVNQEYINDWILGKITISNAEALSTKLWEAKHEYISNIISSHSDGSKNRVTYSGLMGDPNVSEALNAIYTVLEQKLALSIAMRIKLQNYTPLF